MYICLYACMFAGMCMCYAYMSEYVKILYRSFCACMHEAYFSMWTLCSQIILLCLQIILHVRCMYICVEVCTQVVILWAYVWVCLCVSLDLCMCIISPMDILTQRMSEWAETLDPSSRDLSDNIEESDDGNIVLEVIDSPPGKPCLFATDGAGDLALGFDPLGKASEAGEAERVLLAGEELRLEKDAATDRTLQLHTNHIHWIRWCSLEI